MKVLIWVLVLVVILGTVTAAVSRVPKKKERFENDDTVYDCKALMMKSLGLSEQDFQDQYQLDLSSKIDVNNPVCKKYEKLNIGEVVMDMKANVLNIGPDGEEVNDGTCVLPLELMKDKYTNADIKPTIEEHDFQSCSIRKEKGGDPLSYETNILNRYGENSSEGLLAVKAQNKNDEYVHWGCTLDPLDPNFDEALVELYYVKNRPFFQQLAVEADTCFKLEEDKQRFKNALQQALLEKQKQSSITQRRTEINQQAQQRMAAEDRNAKAAAASHTLRHNEHNSARNHYNNTLQYIQNRQGLSFALYRGYFWDNLNFFQNTSLIFNQGRIQNTGSVQNFPNWWQRRELVSVEVKGYFRPSATGWWSFEIGSDDAMYVWLGEAAKQRNPSSGNAFIKLPGLHPTQYTRANIYLQKDAMYPLRIQQGNNYGPWTFFLSFSGPGVRTRTDGTGFYFSADF